jgi:ABC-2 type transport system ATP-binding protein
MDVTERKRRVPEFLDLVGLNGWGDVRLKKFSKGMLQRLGLAQALIHKPKLLILDEPTDGVDPVGRRAIRDILNQLTDTGVTVFINSHLLSEVESFCDYVAILRKGQLAVEGKISNLLAGGGYRVVASSVPEAAQEGLRRAGATFLPVDGGGLAIQVPTRDEANIAIDLIRASGGFIENMTVSTSSLEDLFIQATASEQAA